MEVLKVGEIFYDGKIINADNASIGVITSTLDDVNKKHDATMNKINNILNQLQN